MTRRIAALLPTDLRSRSLYVSPLGDDRNAGAKSSPLLTLARAQQIVQTLTPRMGGNINVYLRGGTYRLPTPLTLGAADGGHSSFNVNYLAYTGEIPVISGGQIVTGWTLYNAPNNIWRAAFSGVTRQLYINGVRARRVRASASALASATLTTPGYSATGGFANTYANIANAANPVELIYNLSWIQLRVPIASATSTTLTMAQPCWANSLTRQQGPSQTPQTGGTMTYVGSPTAFPVFIENAYELLSASTTGQFFDDVANGYLYYVPRTGEDLTTATVIAPILETLLSTTNTSNIKFKGIQFVDATWLHPNTTDGFSQTFGGAYVTGANSNPNPFWAYARMPGNVAVSGGNNVVFESCTFKRLGAAGISVDNGATGFSALGCLFTDISGSGLEIGSPADAKSSTPVTSPTVRSCIVHDTAQEYQGSIGISVWYANTPTVRNNSVFNQPYIGIHCGWGHGQATTQPSVTLNTSILQNNVHDCMQALNDGGGIYSPAPSTGETCVGNVVTNIVNSVGGALYMDDGSQYKTWWNNVSHGVANNVHNNDNIGSNEFSYNFTGDTSHDGTDGVLSTGTPSHLLKNNQVTSVFPASILNAAGIEAAYGGAAQNPLLTPSTPLGLSGGAVSTNSITLTWTAPTSVPGGSIAGYEVWCAINGAAAKIVGMALSATYTFPEVLPSSSYVFTIRAVDTAGHVSRDCASWTLNSSAGVPAISSYSAFQTAAS